MKASVPLSVLRPVWWGLAFFPWLASLIPWFAPPFAWSWFLLAFYFWPAHRLALEWEPQLVEMTWRPLLQFLYCLALASALELAMRASCMHHGRWRTIRRRTAVGAAVATVAIALGILGWRYGQWIDWPSQHASDYALFDRPGHPSKLRVQSVYEMPQPRLFDQLHVARLRVAPDDLPELVRELGLEPLPETEVHEDFWSAPGAHWWRPPRSGRFYATPGFPVMERGKDGDAYLVLQVPGDDLLWLWHLRRYDF